MTVKHAKQQQQQTLLVSGNFDWQCIAKHRDNKGVNQREGGREIEEMRKKEKGELVN